MSRINNVYVKEVSTIIFVLLVFVVVPIFVILAVI